MGVQPTPSKLDAIGGARVHRMFTLVAALFLPGMMFSLSTAAAAEHPLIGQQFQAQDTLKTDDEPIEDARQCLDGLCWQNSEFQVRVEAPIDPKYGEAIVRFPSPCPGSQAAAAEVVMEWSLAVDGEGNAITAPAVVVIHESGPGMQVGRAIAKGFCKRGIHAFHLQLPGYGARKTPGAPKFDARFELVRQGITDVRRARDAVAALPLVEPGKVSLQGTSLGGFVASTAAGLDAAFDKSFFFLSSGNVLGVIQKGEREAKELREKLEKAGIGEEELRELVWRIEPNRLAHRLDPQRTWLYSGIFDQIVPIQNAREFARLAKLDHRHHVQLPVDHFLGFLIINDVLNQMASEITGKTIGRPLIPVD
ncbi:alpha/beta hydrolase family protein [Planctomicrobium sp. SH664]|uniref:alpha/beta hydrolase family protein n=1 Tax=Planctomicrobium sp. SH664 TaxID=3448125 RepID=UPI003F5B3718